VLDYAGLMTIECMNISPVVLSSLLLGSPEYRHGESIILPLDPDRSQFNPVRITTYWALYNIG
jgi:hypothetical protein